MSSVSSATSGTTAAATSSSSTTSSTTSTGSSSSSSKTASDYASSDVTSIDWDGLIDELYQAKLAAADPYETKITTNDNKIAAYQDAESLLKTLETAANALRAPTGTVDSTSDVFESRTAYLTGVGGVDTSSTLAVTADNGAATGTYALTVQQLAQAHKVASATVASSSTDLGYSGTIALGIEGGDAVNIAVTTDMSITDIAGAINDESDASGVQATVLKVSDSAYELVLSSTATGETITATDGGSVLSKLGLIDDDGSFADVLQAPEDAEFTLDGVSVSRTTNDVDDLIDGVTLHLYSTTDDGQSVSVEVGQNLSSVKTAVSTFVDAYNAYRDWAISQQQTASSGSASSTAVLFGDGTIRNINNRIADALNFNLDSTALASLGLSFDDDNKLELDEDTLDNQLLDDADVVQNLFAYSFDSSSTDLRLLARGTSAPSAFSLAVTVGTSGAITGVTVDGQKNMFTVSGSRIIGAAGTEYEGYSFVFTGDASQTIKVNQTSGIAEQIYNIADAAINDDDGTLVSLVDSLTDKNDDYQSQIDDIETRAETYKDNLTTRYATIQANISEAQSTLSYLEALLNASNSSSS